jgi:2-(1,2-epoxy-1,2-dihydrophenyl)acetyl-CoA isomerase
MGHSVETGTDFVRIEVDSGVAVITLNRPDRRNALHDDMYEPFVAAVESFAADPEVGCVVVTGAGSAFCAGGDVRDGSGRRADGVKPTAAERAANLAHNSRITVVLHEAPIVTIAAVNGPAVGAGMAIALACDLRIAAPSARLVTGWARLGFSGDMGGPWLLAHRAGPAKALELLATGSSVDAAEALRLGLVDRVVGNGDDFEAAWRDWAATFASGPRVAIGYMKRNVLNASRLTLAEAVAVEAEHQVAASQTADHREGVRAWVDKREPRFGQPDAPAGAPREEGAP